MRQAVSFLTQSKFYSPAFNAAIFDGPIRIYFAQYQEPLALKIYFDTQSKLKDIYLELRKAFRETGVNVFLMLYPSSEAFDISFADSVDRSEVAVDQLGSDFVIGVRGPIRDEHMAEVNLRLQEITRLVCHSDEVSRLHTSEVSV